MTQNPIPETQAYKFCPICGSDNFIAESTSKLVCKDCGFEYYINPRGCSAALILNSQNQILLAKRARDPQKGMWDLPGGFIDNNESFEEGTIREIQEELGINTEEEELELLTTFNHSYTFKNIQYPTAGVIYIVRLSNKQVAKLTPKDDVAEVKFFDPDKIPFDKIAFNGIKKGLKTYLSLRGKL